MSMSPYYVQYLLNQGDLLSRILAFNSDFGDKQSSLRAQKDNQDMQNSLYKVHPQLAKFHEEHNISYYFENKVDRLCLMRYEELDKLLVYLGACISSHQLAAVNKQSEKDQIYESIGREVYEFALDYGYLIKNLDFMLNLDALKQDCTYLGLCALKCIEPLLSTQELKEYFIEFLIGYAKSRGLDPNIVTTKTHVLSVVYTTSALHQAPDPTQMNNFVQYSPLDIHPKLAKPTAFERKFAEFDAAQAALKAKQEQERLEKERLEREKAEQEALRKQQEMAQAQTMVDIAQNIKVTKAAYAPDIPIKPTVEPQSNSALDFLIKGPDVPQEAPHSTTNQASTPAASPAAKQEAMVETTDGSDNASSTLKQDAQAQSAAPQALSPVQSVEGTSSAPDVPEAAASADGKNEALDDEEALLEQEMEALQAYEDAAIGSINTQDRRLFKAASLKQKSAYQDLVTSKDSSTTSDNEQLEQEQLITLDFNAHQVFTLTSVVLQSQINEHWYEYLHDEH